MENNIDRLFQEGLSADKIEDLSMYSTEKSQWKVVHSKLRKGKKRWFLAKFLPLFLLVGAAGAVFYVSYPLIEGAQPLASEEINTSTVENKVAEVKVLAENNDFGREVNPEQQKENVQGLVGKKELASETLQEDVNFASSKSLKFAKRSNANEHYGHVTKETGYGSPPPKVMRKQEDVVMTNRSSEEAYSYSNKEIGLASSISPYSTGAAANSYENVGDETESREVKAGEEMNASKKYYSTGSNAESKADQNQKREIYANEELNILKIKLETISGLKDAYYLPEDFYQPRLSRWKSLRRGFSFRIGVDGPLHAAHERVGQTGFGYNLGSDLDVTDRWGVSFDYIYENLDRNLTDGFNKYDLPFKSELYQDLKPISSRYEYKRHTYVLGLRYTLLNRGRLNLGFTPSYEFTSRGKAQAEFTYEGAYQLEKENFEFERKLFSTNKLSLGIIADFRLFQKIHLVGRYRRLVPIGTGEDWKLYDRIFVGLSYKI